MLLFSSRCGVKSGCPCQCGDDFLLHHHDREQKRQALRIVIIKALTSLQPAVEAARSLPPAAAAAAAACSFYLLRLFHLLSMSRSTNTIVMCEIRNGEQNLSVCAALHCSCALDLSPSPHRTFKQILSANTFALPCKL